MIKNTRQARVRSVYIVFLRLPKQQPLSVTEYSHPPFYSPCFHIPLLLPTGKACLLVALPFLLIYLVLTLSRRRPLSYRNQSIDLQSKSLDWFQYDDGLRHEAPRMWLSELL